jgi:hypothetical protein
MSTKIVATGNPDLLCKSKAAEASALLKHAVYLENSSVEIDGLNF